jgi:hypothetical protein
VYGNFIVNGDFSNGLTGWTVWTERGDLLVDVAGASNELRMRGTNYNGGVYQVVTVPADVALSFDGYWRTPTFLANEQWGEVIVRNGNNPPINGQDVTTPVAFKNDTWTSTSGWDGIISQTAPVTNNPNAGPLGPGGSSLGVITVILKAGSVVDGTTNVLRWDNIVLTPEPATLALTLIGITVLPGRRRRATR